MKKIYLFGLMATSSLLFAAYENNSSVNKKSKYYHCTSSWFNVRKLRKG
ncbi:hypothetical protein [Liquorilactobacillus mali]|nr:hypothetical protein [Liquorilactobacillus mali]MDC7952289.1 hypothetical protein [Liquorilactobacillus mali]